MKITRIFLYLSVFLIPFYIFRFHFGIFATNIFEIIVLISALVFLIEKPKEYLDYYFWVPLIILVLILLSPILASSDMLRAIGIAKSWFLIPALFSWLIYKNFDQKSFYRLAIPFLASLTLASLWTYFQQSGFMSELFYQKGDASFAQYLAQKRYFGSFESPNYLAMFVVPAFFLCLPLLSRIGNIILKIFIGALFLLPLSALYLTGSRGGQVAFGVSAIVFIALVFVPAIKKNVSVLSAVKVAGIAAANFAYFYFFTRITFSELVSSDKMRQEIYNYSVDMLHKNWFWGIGLGNFQEKVQALSISNCTFINFGLPYALHPHNLFMAIWLNLGIAGLVGFLYVLYVFFKKIISSPPSIMRASLGAAMMAILVHGLFDTTYFKNDLSAIFWLIVVGVLLLVKEKNDEKNI